jgi:hypothetical protein
MRFVVNFVLLILNLTMSEQKFSKRLTTTLPLPSDGIGTKRYLQFHQFGPSLSKLSNLANTLCVNNDQAMTVGPEHGMERAYIQATLHAVMFN